MLVLGPSYKYHQASKILVNMVDKVRTFIKAKCDYYR